MIGICGNEKKDDCVVTVDLSHKESLEVHINSKIKFMFGELMEDAVKDALKDLNIDYGKVEVQDFGALDFIIKARTKTATKRALRGGNN